MNLAVGGPNFCPPTSTRCSGDQPHRRESNGITSAKRTVSRIRRRGCNGGQIGGRNGKGGEERRVSSESDRMPRTDVPLTLPRGTLESISAERASLALGIGGITVIARTHDFHIFHRGVNGVSKCLIYVVPRPR